MRVNLKFQKRRIPLDVNEDATLSDLYEAAAKRIELSSGDFFLSLNTRDPISAENECQRLNQMVVSGDTLWIISLDQSKQPNLSLAPVDIGETCIERKPAASAGTVDTSASEAKDTPKEVIEKLWEEQNPGDSSERLILVLHGFMVHRNFFTENPKQNILSDWRSNVLVVIRYRHRAADTVPELSIRLRTGDWIEVSSFCAKGDADHFASHPVIFSPDKISKLKTDVQEWLEVLGLSLELESKVIQPLCVYSVGYSEPILQTFFAMTDWTERLLRSLDVHSCCSLEKTCSKMKEFTRNEELWMHYIQRDFKAESERILNEARQSHRSFRDAYIRLYEEERRRWQRSILIEDQQPISLGFNPRHPIHDPNAEFDPFNLPGIVRDPDPFGAVRPVIPNVFPNRYPRPRFQDPFHGPRYRPPGWFPGPGNPPPFM